MTLLTVIVKSYDAVFDEIDCDRGTAQDLSDYFSFKVPNYFFIKKKNPKLKGWNGSVNLFSKKTNRLYAGLRSRLELFCRDREIELQVKDQADTEFSRHEALEFIKTLNLPLEPREYQIDAFVKAVRKRRLLILSPTASGKSLILYLLVRYYREVWHGFAKKILIVVPTLNLVQQMWSDFESYGYNAEENIHCIYEGQFKTSFKPIILSTWQSIYDLPSTYFNQDIVIIDEVHLCEAKSLKGIMEKLTNCYYRFGCTGTLKDSHIHRLTLEGLFGEVYEATTTKELIEKNFISNLLVKVVVLKYNDVVCKTNCRLDYQDEVEFLSQHARRNRFIQNLALSLKGNVLVLFRFIEHGKLLYDMLRSQTHRPIYLIHGGTEGEYRERIRKIIAVEKDAILVGSYGTVSTGINIPSLASVIFASPYKSRIRVLQSIGRGLRKSKNKQILEILDISDDLSYKKKKNTTLRHMIERVRLYAEQEFTYKIYKVDIKE